MATAQDEFDALFADKERRSRHPEDEHDGSGDDAHAASSRGKQKQRQNHRLSRLYDSSDDDDDADARAGAAMPSKWYLPRIKSEANTGPKGVIADAHAFEQAKRAKRNSLTAAPAKRLSLTDKDVYANGDKSSEEDEESFMAKWRRSRLQELKSVPKIMGRTSSPSRRVYGSLIPVDADGYLDAIEKVQADTVVVVYIYDDRSEVSSMVEDCVRQLAKKHTTTRFVKLHYQEAEMEVAGVPAILAYRGGDKFAGLVPLMDELPDDAELSATSLGTVMKRHQILV